jgi:hypothetical protein
VLSFSRSPFYCRSHVSPYVISSVFTHFLINISIGLSLAHQIAQLEETAPAGSPLLTRAVQKYIFHFFRSADFDPEDVQITGIDHEEHPVEDSGVRAHYLDVGCVFFFFPSSGWFQPVPL